MIGRAIRMQARSLAGDVVLLGVVAAAFLLSLSLAANVPAELSRAPAAVREAAGGPFGTVLATYAAVLAAVYGSFRYTLDRRDGVIAQRLTMQPRWAMLVARAPATAIGGAVVSLAALIGGHAALAVAMGGIPLDGTAVASTLALGGLAALWGLGVGIVVQAHLAALFVVSFSMGAATLLALFWSDGARYLPLLAMLAAFRFDLSAVGIAPGEGIDAALAWPVAAGWVLLAVLAGGIVFLRRDVR